MDKANHTLGLLSFLVLASCTERTTPERASQPEGAAGIENVENGPEPTQGAAATPETVAKVEAALRTCDGPGLATLRKDLGVEVLGALEGDRELPPSVRVWARWERILAAGEVDDRMALSEFVVAFEGAFGITPPPWWVDQLGSGKWGKSGPGFYDVGLGAGFDRKGKWRTVEAGGFLREGSPTFESEGELALDMSSRRAKLGVAPKAGEMVESVRPRGGTAVYLARFDVGTGGFPFPVQKVQEDEVQWETTSCATGREILGGQGHLTVELGLIDENDAAVGRMAPPRVRAVAVFSAESHGVAFELLDPETGARLHAWTSDMWMAR